MPHEKNGRIDPPTNIMVGPPRVLATSARVRGQSWFRAWRNLLPGEVDLGRMSIDPKEPQGAKRYEEMSIDGVWA